MHRALWVLQILFGAYFIFVGVNHFVLPDGLPAPMSWMYDLSPTLHYVSGTAEILGGLGLIVPGLIRVRPQLVPLAAVGLMLVMFAAAAWHAQRGEVQNIGQNLVIAAVLGFIAYGRFKLRPIEA